MLKNDDETRKTLLLLFVAPLRMITAYQLLHNLFRLIDAELSLAVKLVKLPEITAVGHIFRVLAAASGLCPGNAMMKSIKCYRGMTFTRRGTLVSLSRLYNWP